MVVRKLEMEFSFNPSQVRAEVSKLNSILKTDVGGTDTNSITPKINKEKIKSDISEIKDDLDGFYRRVNSQESVDISVNKAKFQIQLKQLRKDLKDAEKRGDLKAQINIQSNINRVTQSISQANRELRNFARTGKRDVSVLGKLFGGVRTSVGGFSASLRNIIPLLGAAFSVGAISLFSKRLFELGSRLDETNAKFNTVFSGVEGVTQAFDSIADAVGRSRLEIREFGSGIGDILIPLGFAREDAAELSQEIVKLGVDLASFNNISDERAINALRSALTGEREALKSLGIVINEADIKTAALNKGIITQGQELTKTQKALITYQLFLKNTADAQGDAVRTAGSFANQFKRLQGIITDTFANTGVEIAQETAGTLQALADFITTYGSAYIQAFIQIAKAIGAAFQPIIQLIVESVNTLTGALNTGQSNTVTFGKIILFVLASVANGFRVLAFGVRQTITTLGAIIATVVTSISGSFSLIVEAAKLVGIGVADTFKSIPGIIAGNVAKGVNRAIRALNKFIEFANNIPGVNIGTFGLNLDESGAGGSFANTSAQFDALASKAKQNNKILSSIQENFRSDTAANFNTLLSGIENTNSKIFDSVKSTEESKKAQYDATFKSFDDLLNKQGAAQEDADKKAGGAGKKLTEDTKKEAQERAKALEESEAKALKAIRDRVKESKDLVEELGDKIKEESKNSIDEIQDLVDEIQEIGKSFQEQSSEILGDRTTSLADRIVEARDEIRDIEFDLKDDQNLVDQFEGLGKTVNELKEEFGEGDLVGGTNIEDLIKIGEQLEELASLRSELDDSNLAVGSQDVRDAETRAGETETQKIFREAEEELSALREKNLEEIGILQEKVDAEVAILEQFADINKNIQERITADTISELQKRGLSSSDFSGQVGNALSSIQEQSRGNITNSTNTFTFTGDINNQGDLDDVIETIKEAIQ